jgi:succinate dehydrogenase/fumarate reductase flavoprotein subunit
MLREAPNAGDLAARDVIARAMVKEIANGRGCGPKKDHILLSLAHLPAALISERLPSVIQTAQQFARINPLKEAIPVLPTAHYTMGGIPTDISAQVLDQNNQRINGLFAAGEAACSSVHGANRLGCNGLLELLVFGKQAALSIASNNIFANSSALDKQANGLLARYENWLKNENGPAASTTRRNLQKIMSEFCGVERSAEKLKTGIASAQKLFLDAQNFSVREPGLSWNESLREALESENLILQAMACLQAALARDESRGSHWRSDFPDRDDKNWRAHSRVWQKNGEWNFCSSNIRPANDTSLPDMLPENRLY